MVTTRRSSTPSGPTACEADTAASPKREVASTRKKTTRKPQQEENDSAAAAQAAAAPDPPSNRTPLTASGPSSSSKHSASKLNHTAARERELILSRQRRMPKGFLESSLALFKCTLFRADFVLGTYFFDWWESIMVCTFYVCILSLVVYSVYKQASSAGALLQSALASGMAALSQSG